MNGQGTAKEITERLRQASDIVEVVSAYVSLKSAGGSFRGLCPFHNEKTPSFHVNPARQTFKCFGCGAGGDVFKFIQLRENVTFPEARVILANRAGIALEDRPSMAGPSDAPGKLDIERVNRWAAQWFTKQLASPAGEAARAYLERRGVTGESVVAFTLGFAPPGWDTFVSAARQQRISDNLLVAAGLVKPRDGGGYYDVFRNRLMFPIRDGMDRVVGFGGRTLDDDTAKYINSPQTALFDKSRCLFGVATAKDAFRERRSAILVEGYMDCLVAQQFGFRNTVATLGTALTADHVRLLSRYVDSVLLVFDSDEAGQKAADASLSLFLTEKLDVRLAHVPEGKDPADFLVLRGKEAFAEVLTSGVSALEFKWKQVMRRCRGQASQLDRRRAVEEFLGLLVRSADLGSFDPIQRGLILNQVGKLLAISPGEVERQIRILARRQTPVRAAGVAATEGGSGAFRTARMAYDDYDTAVRDLLSVMLNEPVYYDDVAGVFDPEMVRDPVLAEVARHFATMMRSEEEYSVAALISRFEAVEAAALITDLQEQGLRRGNSEATIRGALARLQQVKEHRRLNLLAAGLRGPGNRADAGNDGSAGQDAGSEDADTRSVLRAVEDAARRVSHFAANKHLAAPLTAGAEALSSQAE